MDGIGGLEGWRWIFILEGIATVLAALVAAVFLPADLSSAKFFTEEERAFSCERFSSDRLIHLNVVQYIGSDARTPLSRQPRYLNHRRK